MQWLYPLLKSHISLSKISGEARSEKHTSYNRTKYKKRAEFIQVIQLCNNCSQSICQTDHIDG